MRRPSPFIAHALSAVLVLVSILGWTVFEALTAERSFEGRITIQALRKLPDGKFEVVDEFQGSGVNFRMSVADAARGKQVETNWVLNGKSAKGRPVTFRLARPGAADVNLQAGSVVLRLPIESNVGGKRVEQLLTLGTDQSVSGPSGVIRGERAKIANGQAPVRVVGELVDLGEFRKILELEGDELIEEQRAVQPGAVDKRVGIADRSQGTASLIVIAEGTVKALDKTAP